MQQPNHPRTNGPSWVLPLAFAVSALLSSAASADVSTPAGFPLRNGCFSNYKSHGRPTDWYNVTAAGTYSFSIEPEPIGIQNPESTVVITCAVPGNAYWVQSVDLPSGNYTLTADVYATAGTTARLATPGYSVDITGNDDWQSSSLDFTSDGVTGIYLFSVAGLGTVKFRRANVAIGELISSPVQMNDNSTLGGIVIGPAADVAEQFAAYELQRIVGRMTGSMPGLEGRDNTVPGRRILLGTAASPAVLAPLVGTPPDSYVIAMDGDDIVLAGNTSRGTIYAVYGFLRLQGCQWYLPGEVGQVIPERPSLLLPNANRVESPAYDVRGFNVLPGTFHLDGGWVNCNIEDYLDWGVRNSLNALLFAYSPSADFGEHRGGGHVQTANHSWHLFLLDDHPEWWALVDGVRTKLSPSGRPNQLCVSNSQLRDYVVATVLQFFADNPQADIYALNANDYTYWCECAPCRALDPDGGTEPWVKNGIGFPELGMSDRSINFVNEIAGRVVAIYPGKQIEMYAYAATQKPPTFETVHPSVLIKYTWHGAPLNRPILDLSYDMNAQTLTEITGWSNAGVQQFGLYDYGNFWHPDCPNFWFYHQTDYLKTFNQQWGFRHALGELDHTIAQSLPWYHLRTLSYWNPDIDYLAEVNAFCQRFYGPAASDMYGYYVFMQQQELDSLIWEQPDAMIQSLNLVDFNLDVMATGLGYLNRAQDQITGDSTLTHRLAIARFGHAVMTVEVGKQQQNLNWVQKRDVGDGFFLANELSRTYDLRVQQSTVDLLQQLWFVPYGHVWDRSADWTAASNPDDGALDYDVWRYQYVTRGDALGQAQPWYTQQPYDMIWYTSYWRYSAESAPRIYPDYMQCHLGRLANPLLSWTNTTGDTFELNTAGTLTVYWGAYCDATDVDIALAHKDSATGQFTELYASSVTKPHGKVSYEESVVIPIDVQEVQLSNDDEIRITMRPASTTGLGLLNLYDNLTLTVVEPQPDYCGDEGTIFHSADITGTNGTPDCYVDFLDLSLFLDNWLTCTDPTNSRCNEY